MCRKHSFRICTPKRAPGRWRGSRVRQVSGTKAARSGREETRPACAKVFVPLFCGPRPPPEAGVRSPGEGGLFQLINLASFPSRCAARIRLLSVPSYFGPIRDLMCLLLFLSIFLCLSVPPGVLRDASVLQREAAETLALSFLSELAYRLHF